MSALAHYNKLLVLYCLLTNRFYLNKFQVRRPKLVISVIRLVDITVAAIVGILDLAWLTLYGTVACRASHFIELPCQTSFSSFFILFFVSPLSAAQHLAPAVVCDSSFYCRSCVLLYCNYVRP